MKISDILLFLIKQPLYFSKSLFKGENWTPLFWENFENSTTPFINRAVPTMCCWRFSHIWNKNIPKSHWLLAQIASGCSEDDKIVRTAKIQKPIGELIKPSQLLLLLDNSIQKPVCIITFHWGRRLFRHI